MCEVVVQGSHLVLLDGILESLQRRLLCLGRCRRRGESEDGLRQPEVGELEVLRVSHGCRVCETVYGRVE